MICTHLTVRHRTRLTITARGTGSFLTIRKGPLYRVAVGRQGPAGPAGPEGGKYDHTQAVAATVWTIAHNLGYRPCVNVFSDGGIKRSAEVRHLSGNVCEVHLNTARTGTAHLS